MLYQLSYFRTRDSHFLKYESQKNPLIYYEPLFGAENETRTRDPNLGKVVLYQLSYFRRDLCDVRVTLSGVALVSEEEETRTPTG